MSYRPLLSLEEIVSHGSIAELRQAYANKGYGFRTEAEFLKAVRNDSFEGLDKEFRKEFQSKGYELIKPLPYVEVVTPNRDNCKIYGIMHDVSAGFAHLISVNIVANQAGNLLSEQTFRRIAPALQEIPDHKLLGRDHYLKNYLDSLIKGATLPLLVARYFVNKFTTHLFNQPSIKAIEKAELQGRFNRKIVDWIEDGRYDLLDLVNNFIPTAIYLELKERNYNPKYNSTQRRSAYMAEFLNAWKKGDDKIILVGAAHVMEMQHFSKHRVKDKEVIETAQRDAELLEKDPERFERELISTYYKRGVKEIFSKSMGYATPYIIAGTLLL